MAFSPDGMFYLSQAELEPTTKIIGGAARGMLGLQNKEELVNEILQGADYKTPEGRRAALDQIRAIDPDRWATLNKQNQDYETQELALTKGYNTPVLKTEWRLDVGKNFTTLYANENLPGQPEGLDTRTKIIKYLNSLVSAGTIKNQIKKDWMKDYDLAYKAKGEAYVSTNALKGKQAGKGGVSADSVLSQDKKLDIPKTADAQQRILVRELESLPEIARLAAQANPKNNQAIYAELKKRQLELHSKINALTPKIDEEALSEYHGQATSIFDTNAAKYKKNPNYY